MVIPGRGSTNAGAGGATTAIAGFELVIDSTETGNIVTTTTTLVPTATDSSQP